MTNNFTRNLHRAGSTTIQYNTLNVKFSNLQLKKIKSARKNGPEVTLNLSTNAICNSHDVTNIPFKLLLNNAQVSRICKAFSNGSSAVMKISKTFA